MHAGVPGSLRPDPGESTGKPWPRSSSGAPKPLPAVSLRAILICWVGLALAATLLVASVIVYWRAAQKVDVILTLAMLALLCLLGAVLVLWLSGKGLRNGFNQMLERVADMQRRERQLEEQLVAVQEEERAEIAQNVHDEIGPLLFAVSVDLSALQGYATSHPDAEVRTRLAATQEAVSEIQRHVKGILQRLRPATVADLGLLHSIEQIVAFWRAHYPAVIFTVNVTEEPVDKDIARRIVRITQESISNALRHGRPDRVEVDVTVDANGTAVTIRDDGAGLQADEPAAGWGLQGMRNQVDSAGGVLTIAPGTDGRGVVVSARFPASEHPV